MAMTEELALNDCHARLETCQTPEDVIAVLGPPDRISHQAELPESVRERVERGFRERGSERMLFSQSFTYSSLYDPVVITVFFLLNGRREMIAHRMR